MPRVPGSVKNLHNNNNARHLLSHGACKNTSMVATTPHPSFAREAPDGASAARHASTHPDAEESIIWSGDSRATWRQCFVARLKNDGRSNIDRATVNLILKDFTLPKVIGEVYF